MAEPQDPTIDEPQEPTIDEPQVGAQTAQQNEPVNPYQTIIEQKDAQISALLEQTNKLTEQITKMINSGTQINDGTKPTEPATQPLQGGYGFGKGNVSLSDDDDFSVSALGNLIGRR